MKKCETVRMDERTQSFIDKVRQLNESYFEEQGKNRLANVHSYGCQQNVADGEQIKGLLSEMGYGFTDAAADADLVIYNTCAVRENAEARIFGNVGELKHNKRRNPGMLIGLCGCMMQQEHVVEKIKKSYPYVDLVVGTHALHQMPELLASLLTGGKRTFKTMDATADIVEGMPIVRDSDIKAWVPIMHGCNNFCTYCIVPYVRGRERSRQPEHILAEIQGLVEQGYKEITLLGQNVNSYGKGLSEPVNFSELLRRIDAIPGKFRVRFMTSHPRDCTRELIDTIAACEKLCNHIHLPVQSGSDRVLKAMNRHYTRESYLDLIAYAKEKIPGITFTSDIIVGFPGETYEEFLETLSLVQEVGYSILYTFLYSRRTGTKAAEMSDPVPAAEKSQWFRQLLDTQNDIGYTMNKALVGSTVEVLADGFGKNGEEYISGRTTSNVIVDFIAPPEVIGSFVTVKVTQALKWAVVGELIQ